MDGRSKTDMADYSGLYQAVSALASRCDGAKTLDGVGFNGQDTKFGRRAAEMPLDTWSVEIACEVSRMLPLYRKQLESMGYKLDEIGLITSDTHDSVKARDQARQAEYARNNAPYVIMNGETVKVCKSFPIKDELSRNGFKFTSATRSWDAPLNGRTAATVLNLGVKLTEVQKQLFQSIPADEGKKDIPAVTAENIRVCDIHHNHLILQTPKFGTVPLAVTRAIPGRKWDGTRKVDCISANIYLYRLADEYNLTISDKAREMIENGREADEKAQAILDASIADSKATATDQVVAIQDNLYPFQRAGVAYALNHPSTLIADEMGLGKTRQAISTLETKQSYPALVVCPSNLVENWIREIHNLLPHRKTTAPAGRGKGQRLSKADIIIIGWSTVDSWVQSLPVLAGLVADESQYMKSDKAGRTRAIRIITGSWFEKKTNTLFPGRMASNPTIVFLSGTPVLNRPSELIQPLIALGYLYQGKVNPNAQMSVYDFKNRYCGPETTSWGTTYGGASNTGELHYWLRQTCMVQRSKNDVLTELPPKIRAPLFITMDSGATKTYLDMAKAGAQDAAKGGRAEAIIYLNKLRQAVATAKTQIAINWANDFMETEKSLIIFAVHKDVQNALVTQLRAKGHKVGQILGGQKDVEEQKRAFQAGETKIIVLSLTSAKEGHTLTKASDVLFVEQGWNAATQDQAEDRSHRIGQDNPVTCWYIIAQETIDEWLYELVESKRKVTNMVNKGISVEMAEENIFRDLLDKAISTYGGR
jgi:SNF2 family DNA or RNA helicase